MKRSTGMAFAVSLVLLLTSATAWADWEPCGWDSVSGTRTDETRIDIECSAKAGTVTVRVANVGTREFEHIAIRGEMRFEDGLESTRTVKLWSESDRGYLLDSDAGFAAIEDWNILDVRVKWNDPPSKPQTSDPQTAQTQSQGDEESSASTKGQDADEPSSFTASTNSSSSSSSVSKSNPGSSNTTSSSTSSALGTAAKLADEAGESGGSDDNGGSAVVLGGGGVAAAVSGVSTAVGSSGSDTDARTVALRDFVVDNPHSWRPFVFGLSFGVAGILLVNGAASLIRNRGLFERRPSDKVQPHRFHPLAFLLGPDGPGSWWSRFEFLPSMGYFSASYRGAYIDRVPDRGVAVEQQLHGVSSGAAVHYGLFRLSFAYIGTNVDLFEGYDSELRSRFAYPIHRPESQTLQGWQGSMGLQAFQGLLSPYVEARFNHLRPAAPVATVRSDIDDFIEAEQTYNLGAFYLPMSWDLVIGNTLNFAGSFSSEGPLRNSFFLDVSTSLAHLGGPLRGGLRLVGGFGVSWF